MTIWKDQKRGVWIAKFRHQHRQYKKEGFQNRKEAMHWEVEKREELLVPVKPEKIHLTFSQVSNAYLENCQARFQKNTWRQKTFVLRNFLTFLQDDPYVDELSKQDFGEYLKLRREQAGNIASNRDLKEIKALFNWGIRQELVLKNPCMNIENYPEQSKIKYVPPADDINKVLLAADYDDMDLIQILYHTAGRISEVLNLTWEDVNFEQRWVRLWTRKRRGGELQEDKLAMTDTLFDVLHRRWNKRDKSVPYVFFHINGSQLTYLDKRYVMKKLCKKAGVKPFGYHAIRHHVASILADSGKASLSQIQKMLRHKRTTTTDTYIKTLDPQLRQVADVLDNQTKALENGNSLSKAVR